MMDFKQFLKEQIKKVDNDDDLVLLIYFNDSAMFKYHKGCFADFQEDFCILYEDKINMSFRYDSIVMMQLGSIKDITEKLGVDLIRTLFEEL